MRKATRLIVFLLILTFIFTATTACNDKGYSISFVSFGEEVAIIKLKGKGEIHLPNLSKDGFIFLGWFLDENIWNNPFTDTYFSEKKIDRNYVVYARWKEVEQVIINFETFGGEDLVSITTEQGSSTTLPLPNKDGYTFLYWCKTKDLNSKVDDTTIFYKDTKLYAKWLSDTPISQNFVVTINAIPENPPMEITVGYGQKLSIPKIRRISYMLDNFYVDERFSTAFDTDIVVTTNFSLYANWLYIDDSFTVSFVSNAQNAVNPLSVRYDELVNEPYIEKEGYFFEGWYIDSDYSKEYDFLNKGITNDITLYAKWRVEEPGTPQRDYYIITYSNNGGSGIASTSVNIGQEPSLSVPTKGSEKFGGWFFDASFSMPYVFDVNNTADFTLYAKWNSELTQLGFTFEESSSYDGLILVNYTGTSENGMVTIPDTVSGRNVVEIGNGAFKQKTIRSVVLPTYLVSISDEAFYDISGLIEVTINGAALRSIGERAFAKTSLISLTFNQSLVDVGNRAFSESSLKTITLAGEATIGEGAFYDCKELTTINMSKVKEVYQTAFYGCSLLENVNLAGCEKIYAMAFSRCIALKNISLASCVSIGSEAFAYCTNLSQVSLPLIEILEAQAFMSSGISSIALPEVISIGGGALGNCWNLELVEIGDALSSLGEDVFLNSNKISFSVDENNVIFSSGSESLLSKDGTVLFAVGNISAEKEYSIPEGVISINMFAFNSGKNITKLNICSSITSLDMSLAMIETLEQVTVHQDNTTFTVGEDGNLYSIENEQKTLIRYMPKSANTAFTFDETITSIASGAFAHCTNLITVTLDINMTVISNAAFYKCYSLEEVINTMQITEYKDFCFAECTKLSIIIAEDAVIGSDAFTNTLSVTTSPTPEK